MREFHGGRDILSLLADVIRRHEALGVSREQSYDPYSRVGKCLRSGKFPVRSEAVPGVRPLYKDPSTPDSPVNSRRSPSHAIMSVQTGGGALLAGFEVMAYARKAATAKGWTMMAGTQDEEVHELVWIVAKKGAISPIPQVQGRRVVGAV